ncbi:[FeFe] hydrogenase, group A [Candidatus Izimaplasma bacterium]|nr:[FeFe] hydrogenase, group A [Candidatus Izimaplasma bacterium]
MAKITINGQTIKVKNGTSILNAAVSIGVEIPTLCFIKEINEIGFCRICVVEVEGVQDLISACNTEVANGMVIYTDSDKVIESRTTSLQLLASRHRFDCWRCPKDGMCEFYDLLKYHDVVFEEFGPGVGRNSEIIPGTGISQDQSKCVLCKRCVAVCNEVVTAKVLKFRDDDGINPIVSPTPGLSFDESGCIFCGQCVKSCPTGTLFETDHVKKVEALLRDRNKTVAVQISPAVKSSIAEEFGYLVGHPVQDIEPKIYEALELLGFNEITDTTWATDLTIFEESNELIDRLQNGGTLPLFTSSCPAWVRYTELYKPEFLEHLSTAKSPHMMQGALIKAYYGPKYLNKKPEEMAVVSIMPCTAKKHEISREEMEVDGVRDVDAVLTVREIAKMIKRKGIDFKRLEGKEVASKLRELSGVASIKGSSGNVMEATLESVSQLLAKEPLQPFTFKTTFGDNTVSHGMIKEATVTIAGNKLNIAVVQGGTAIKEMYERIENGKKQYHYIEVMTCPGGCVNGGGTPIVQDLPVHEVIRRRSEALCNQDEQDVPLRKAHENEAVLKAYDEFLEKANSKKAHKYLHTSFSKKDFRKE